MAVLRAESRKLRLRLTRAEKAKLREAAAMVHCSVGRFVLESARVRADQLLADRRVFILNAEKWKEFQAALDAPPRPLPRLKRLLDEPSIFTEGPGV